MKGIHWWPEDSQSQRSSNAQSFSMPWHHHGNYTPASTKLKGGYTGITLSVCPSVLPSQGQIFYHDDVMKWKHFPCYWPFVRGIHRLPVNSPHKGQWRGTLMFSLIWVWMNGWVNNREAGDLRHHRTHYDVTVMWQQPLHKSPSRAGYGVAIVSNVEKIDHLLFWDKTVHRAVVWSMELPSSLLI